MRLPINLRKAEEFDLPDVSGISDVLQVAVLGTREEYESKRKDVIMKCGQLHTWATIELDRRNCCTDCYFSFCR